MSSLSFTKLFSSITDSSVWQESADTRLVWITMLSMADQLGRIHAAIPGLAHRARVSLKATEEALDLFLQPDPYSRSKDHDGRRIEVIEGGWRLLNYSVYREQKDEEARREKNRIYQQRFRDKAASGTDDNPIPGYIYYAQNGEHVKIGFSKNPWSRISELKCACPTLELVALERGAMQDEKNRHEMFSHLHHDREWFRLEADLLEYINSLPILDKLKYGRYRNAPPSPVVQSVAKNVVNYDELRRTTKAQAEVEAEAEAIKKVPSRGKREADPRHVPFKIACETYSTYKRVEFVWDAGEAKQLAMLLAASPGLTLETFQRCLNHRAKSEVAHGDRPREWLGTILKYQEGPLDKYGKPQGAGNGTNQGNHKPNAAVDRQRITHDAIREAGRRRYGLGAADNDGRGTGSQAEPDIAGGDAGYVPPGMGGDSAEIRFDDFPGRTLEGTP